MSNVPAGAAGSPIGTAATSAGPPSNGTAPEQAPAGSQPAGRGVPAKRRASAAAGPGFGTLVRFRNALATSPSLASRIAIASMSRFSRVEGVRFSWTKAASREAR